MKREPILQREYSIELKDIDGVRYSAIVKCIDISLTMSKLGQNQVLLLLNNQILEGYGNDYFAAFDQIRIELESQNLLPLVNGANRNCYPSGMARDMGSGLAVYRLELGVQMGNMNQLLQTFESNEVSEPVTVKEQKEFYSKWSSSLK